jgi:hypothetical protein
MGVRGRPHPLCDGSCGGRKEGPPGPTLRWCIREKGERNGKGQTEEVRKKKGVRGEKEKNKEEK